MWKWLAVNIGCILLLQGCISDDKEELKIQEKERQGVNEVIERILTKEGAK
ncbi:hypothetical protein [Peribacillus sp. NPDC096540]|uniref:hypothetical protein n=1 Tax=Peribacillus sp. NPDC096540 TaxID=3390612 RepID=UPI003CFE25D1